MGHDCCCVVQCKNNGGNSTCKFYIFPRAAYKLEQRIKWIAAVKRRNVDGTPWSPKPHDKICSAHFIGGKKSEEQLSPSYVPTIFPTIYLKKKVNESQVLARYTRFIARRAIQISKCTTTSTQMIKEVENEFIQPQQLMTDKGCQANVFSELILKETTFSCNRYIYNDHCDAEIQVDIAFISRIISTNTSKKKDKSCCTDQKTYKDQSTSTNGAEFVGILSIKKDQQLNTSDDTSIIDL